MKRLSSLLVSLTVLSYATGCSNTENVTLPVEQQVNIQSKEQEKPITKEKVSVKKAEFKDSDFSKLVDKNKTKTFKTDEAFSQKPAKNGLYDDYLPYRTFNDFERDVRYTTDYKFLGLRNARYNFNKNYSAYQYAQNIYKATSYDMKRFIALDMLVNSLAINGYEMSNHETHNPPFSPEYKMLPTRAAQVMPTFGEIYDYNRYGSGAPYIEWNMERAASFYHSNYARYMAMIMEFAPNDKYKVYDLVHREISRYAGY